MTKKSIVTQNLVNGFPDWSRIRQDEQSFGQSLLNVAGLSMEPLVTDLTRGYSNLLLSTANVDEIDLTYIYELPDSFTFTQVGSSDTDPTFKSPTVSGLVDSTWYLVSDTKTKTVKDFWYNAIPTRITLDNTYSGVTPLLLSIDGDQLSTSTIEDIILPNTLNLVTVSGTQYFTVEKQIPHRAKVRLTGTNWKDLEDEEEMLFLFDQSKRSLKPWKDISKVEIVDFPEDGNLKIYSHNFNLPNRPDPFNDQYQFHDTRDNMSVFWTIVESTTTGAKLLQQNRYAVNSAIDLLKNITNLVPTRSWELLNSANNPITALDIVPIPYTQRAWVIDSSKLYLYDLDWNLPDITRLTDRISAPLIRLETNSDYITRDEEVSVDLLFLRPIKTLHRHRLKIQYPDLAEFGILTNGSLVSTSSDYWVNKIQGERFIRNTTILQLSDLGEHILTLECEFVDGTIEIDQRIILVDSKVPLAEFSLEVTGSGIDIDHLNRLLVIDTNTDVHHIVPHYDVMLVDPINRELIFREPYEQVKVIP